MFRFWMFALIAALLALPVVGCGDDDDDSGATDTDTDTDTDSDTDSDTDTDTDTDSDTDTDTDSDTDVASTLTVELDGGPDGSFLEDCETDLAAGGTSWGYGVADGTDGTIKWGLTTSTAVEFAGEVYTSYGGPTTAGTYTIDATEADYATCGICLLVVDDEYNTYMPVADSGSITFEDYPIDAPVGAEFSGSFDLMMQEVEINSSTLATTPVAGGCSSPLTGTWYGTLGTFPEE